MIIFMSKRAVVFTLGFRFIEPTASICKVSEGLLVLEVFWLSVSERVVISNESSCVFFRMLYPRHQPY